MILSRNRVRVHLLRIQVMLNYLCASLTRGFKMITKKKAKEFIYCMLDEFYISLPTVVRTKKGMGCQALYKYTVDEYGMPYHEIILSKDHGITEETCLHELVHAWQCENGKKVGHGKSFDKWRKICNDWGYGEIR